MKIDVVGEKGAEVKPIDKHRTGFTGVSYWLATTKIYFSKKYTHVFIIIISKFHKTKPIKMIQSTSPTDFIILVIKKK